MIRTVEIKESEFKCGNALSEVIHEIAEAHHDNIDTLNIIGLNTYRKHSFECNARLYLENAVKVGKIRDFNLIFK